MTLRPLLLQVIKRKMSKNYLHPGRDNFLRHHEYYMAVAILISKCSHDPDAQVGACLVKDSRVIGSGCNNFPDGCENKFPWGKKKENLLESKHSYVVHAEANAILNARSDQLRDSSLYVTRYPCKECAKLIVQSGIKDVIYLRDKEDDSTLVSKRMFPVAGVQVTMYDGCKDTIQIEFE